MIMEQVLAGDIGQEPALLKHSPEIPLRRIFESEEIGLFHLALAPGQRVPIGHDDLVSVVLCLAGGLSLIRSGEALGVEVGSYAVIPEGQICALAASDEATKVLWFLGFEQLPGAFFNSYGPADV
jgi:quercetin dioxygenase-like cupin family protein